jgi:hypothetical protein
MISVVCVEQGNYLNRGAEYVARLQAMVAKHLGLAHEFVCLTDDPARHAELRSRQDIRLHKLYSPIRHGVAGWWCKVELFFEAYWCGAPGDRIVYFDLDTVIIGSIDALAQHKGIIHLDRWGWARQVYGSGVMVWDAGEHPEIWTRFDPAVMSRCHGDQDWITEVSTWPALPDSVRSYRYHCQEEGPPEGTSVVCFHGEPKPHQFAARWVAENWRL